MEITIEWAEVARKYVVIGWVSTPWICCERDEICKRFRNEHLRTKYTTSLRWIQTFSFCDYFVENAILTQNIFVFDVLLNECFWLCELFAQS